ncbi:MAG: DUF952 domain-containing protein, partial [Chloroflexota bacterium]
LDQEGFIHCSSSPEIVVRVANNYFDHLQDKLLVLEIDPNLLKSPLKFEPPNPPPQAKLKSSRPLSHHQPNLLFPHIYGPLNRQAIIRTFLLERDLKGFWSIFSQAASTEE